MQKKSIVMESISVVAWEWDVREGQRGGIVKGHSETAGEESISSIVIVLRAVMISWVYKPNF